MHASIDNTTSHNHDVYGHESCLISPNFADTPIFHGWHTGTTSRNRKSAALLMPRSVTYPAHPGGAWVCLQFQLRMNLHPRWSITTQKKQLFTINMAPNSKNLEVY